MVFPADFSAQGETERHIGGSFAVSAEYVDNSDYLIQVCSAHRFLMVSFFS